MASSRWLISDPVEKARPAPDTTPICASSSLSRRSSAATYSTSPLLVKALSFSGRLSLM